MFLNFDIYQIHPVISTKYSHDIKFRAVASRGAFETSVNPIPNFYHHNSMSRDCLINNRITIIG